MYLDMHVPGRFLRNLFHTYCKSPNDDPTDGRTTAELYRRFFPTLNGPDNGYKCDASNAITRLYFGLLCKFTMGDVELLSQGVFFQDETGEVVECKPTFNATGIYKVRLAILMYQLQ